MKNIKLKRSQSFLKELIPMALANLDDTRLNALSVVDVKCSKGKYFAQVLLCAPDASKQEQQIILTQLKKAKHLIKEYCLEATGWFRCPDFDFVFDESLEQVNRLEKIFQHLQQTNNQNNQAKKSS